MTLQDAHAAFRFWLGAEYDLAALDVVLSVAAVEQLGGDPPWLLIVGGSGNAKTETVGSLVGAGATVTSTITSEGALLSATPARDREKGATGGLLRKVGSRGLVVVKDFTSILSMNKDMRASVLAALREVYDGRWERNVGTDGGRTLTWAGRLVFLAAVTTAWDTHHSAVAAMGDRFALVRLDSTAGRLQAGRQALANVDHETSMRAELARAACDALGRLDQDVAVLTESARDELLRAADLVTYARTAVERDHQGNIIDAHAPEMPTRFAKMLGQIVRGGLALGMTSERAMATAIRVAGDSMPPLRLRLLADVGDNPDSRTSDAQKRLQKPRTTIDRELQALHVLGLLVCDDTGQGGWRYSLSDAVDQSTLKTLVTRKVSTGTRGHRRERVSTTDFSGDPLTLAGIEDIGPVVLPNEARCLCGAVAPIGGLCPRCTSEADSQPTDEES